MDKQRGHTEPILRSVVNHRQNNWEDIFPLCEFAYNDMTHGSTQSPLFFLNYGQNPCSAEDLSWNIRIPHERRCKRLAAGEATVTHYCQGLFVGGHGSSGIQC